MYLKLKAKCFISPKKKHSTQELEYSTRMITRFWPIQYYGFADLMRLADLPFCSLIHTFICTIHQMDSTTFINRCRNMKMVTSHPWAIQCISCG